MKPSNFITALTILSDYHTNELFINKPTTNFIGNLTNGSPTIKIKSCCAGAINALKDANFTLSMSDGLMLIEDYSI